MPSKNNSRSNSKSLSELILRMSIDWRRAWAAISTAQTEVQAQAAFERMLLPEWRLTPSHPDALQEGLYRFTQRTFASNCIDHLAQQQWYFAADHLLNWIERHFELTDEEGPWHLTLVRYALRCAVVRDDLLAGKWCLTKHTEKSFSVLSTDTVCWLLRRREWLFASERLACVDSAQQPKLGRRIYQREIYANDLAALQWLDSHIPPLDTLVLDWERIAHTCRAPVIRYLLAVHPLNLREAWTPLVRANRADIVRVLIGARGGLDARYGSHRVLFDAMLVGGAPLLRLLRCHRLIQAEHVTWFAKTRFPTADCRVRRQVLRAAAMHSKSRLASALGLAMLSAVSARQPAALLFAVRRFMRLPRDTEVLSEDSDSATRIVFRELLDERFSEATTCHLEYSLGRTRPETHPLDSKAELPRILLCEDVLVALASAFGMADARGPFGLPCARIAPPRCLPALARGVLRCIPSSRRALLEV